MHPAHAERWVSFASRNGSCFPPNPRNRASQKWHYTCNVMQCNAMSAGRILFLAYQGNVVQPKPARAVSMRSVAHGIDLGLLATVRPTSLFERSLLPTLHHHSPNRLIGTRIAPLVARVSSLHEALVHPTIVAAAAAAPRPPPHVGFSAACASHVGLFLAAAHPASRPGLMMIICAQTDVGTVE